MLLQTLPTADGGSAWAVLLVFLLISAPIYLFMRYFVRIVRQVYGFETVVDDGPPLRVCSSCHNSVLETDYVHCPYCGAALPPAEPEVLEPDADFVADAPGPSAEPATLTDEDRTGSPMG